MYTVLAMDGSDNKRFIGLAAGWSSVTLFIVAYLVVSNLVKTSQAPLVRDLFYGFFGFSMVGAFSIAAVKSKKSEKTIWIGLVAAAVSWATGDISLRLCEALGIFGEMRTLCVSDIFYIIAYVIITYLVILLAGLTGKPDTRRLWFRYYPLVLSAFVVILSVILAFYLPKGIAGAPLGERGISLNTIVNFLYTSWDLGLLASLLLLVLVHQIPFRKTWHELLIFAFSLLSIADFSYGLFKPAGIFDPSNIQTQSIIAVWMLSYGVFSMAAILKITEPS